VLQSGEPFEALATEVLPYSELRERAKSAPDMPGCYLFYDALGNVIYVGKAKRLRNRVTSYFNPAALENERTAFLVRRIANLRFITTNCELDALLLEYQLIKSHKPWYNSQLKPDKPRPYLRLAFVQPYPCLSIADEPDDDDALYYDCFTGTEDIKRTLVLLCRAWGIAQCDQQVFMRLKGPCIYRELDGCLAPCNGQVDQAEYHTRIKEVVKLLEGKKVRRLAELRRDLRFAVEDLDFELADNLQSLIDGLIQLRHKSHRRYHLPKSGLALILIRPYREKAFSAFLTSGCQAVFRIDFPVQSDETLVMQAAALLADVGRSIDSRQLDDIELPDTGITISVAPELDTVAVDSFNLYDVDLGADVFSMTGADAFSMTGAELASGLIEVLANKQFVLLPQSGDIAGIAARAISKFMQ
jgi:excinuclease UvrABC nuclease subunit